MSLSTGSKPTRSIISMISCLIIFTSLFDSTEYECVSSPPSVMVPGYLDYLASWAEDALAATFSPQARN